MSFEKNQQFIGCENILSEIKNQFRNRHRVALYKLEDIKY
jgi:hypothetical protein